MDTIAGVLGFSAGVLMGGAIIYGAIELYGWWKRRREARKSPATIRLTCTIVEPKSGCKYEIRCDSIMVPLTLDAPAGEIADAVLNVLKPYLSGDGLPFAAPLSKGEE